jgi:hypothetical protein
MFIGFSLAVENKQKVEFILFSSAFIGFWK